jgi:hypothetical protein
MFFFAKLSLKDSVQSAGLMMPEIHSNDAVLKLDELGRPDSWAG